MVTRQNVESKKINMNKKHKQKKARGIIRAYHKLSDCIGDKHVAKAQVRLFKNRKKKK